MHDDTRKGRTDTTPGDPAEIVRALKALPDGAYLMTSAFEDERAGVMVRGVLGASIDPPLIVVASRKGHAIDPIIRDARCFALGLVDAEDRLLRKQFRFSGTAASARANPSAGDPFDNFPDMRLTTGSPILDRCKVWLDCEVSRHVDLEGDYELFVGLVIAARCPQ